MHYTATHSSENSMQSIDSNKKIQIKYPEDIQKIISNTRNNYGNLYLSNIEAAQNVALLSSLQITSILSVAKGYDPKHSKDQVRYQKYVPLQDHQNIDIHRYLNQCVEFISEKLLFTNVLIHCVAGVGRSVCFAIAYLMKEKRMELQEAYKFMKSLKIMINLSKPMMEQLKKYQLDLMNQGKRKKYNYSVRTNTNANLSEIHQSYFKEQSFNERSVIAQMYTHQDKTIQLDETIKISQKSICLQKKNPFFDIKGGIKTENPQENKLQELPDLNIKLSKKKSSRDEYEKRMHAIETKNKQLNNSLRSIQQKYECQLLASRMNLQKQLPNQFQQKSIKKSLFIDFSK